MDVRRPCVERIRDDERDEPDHRRFGGEILQLLDVGIERKIVATLLDVADDLADRGAARTVESFKRRIELVRNRDQRLYIAAGHHPKRADRVLIGRIGHRKRELMLVLAHGKCPRFAQEPRGDPLLEDWKLRVTGGIDEGQVELRGQRLGDVALRAHAERHQQRTELFATFLLHAERALEPRGIDLASLEQDFADAFANRSVHAWCRSGNEKIGR